MTIERSKYGAKAVVLLYLIHFITECSRHCSLCFNETECFECTQGYYLDAGLECSRMLIVLSLTKT